MVFFRAGSCQYDPIWLGTVWLISTKWRLEPPRLGEPGSRFADPGQGSIAPLQDEATKLPCRWPLLWLQRGVWLAVASTLSDEIGRR
jgi:hypothetical protein